MNDKEKIEKALEMLVQMKEELEGFQKRNYEAWSI